MVGEAVGDCDGHLDGEVGGDGKVVGAALGLFKGYNDGDTVSDRVGELNGFPCTEYRDESNDGADELADGIVESLPLSASANLVAAEDLVWVGV